MSAHTINHYFISIWCEQITTNLVNEYLAKYYVKPITINLQLSENIIKTMIDSIIKRKELGTGLLD
jgi:hypothetical protein